MGQYKYGRKKELTMAQFLRNKRWRVSTSKASRGAEELLAEKGQRTWLIQSKATRGENFPVISSKDKQRLKAKAKRHNAIPVLGATLQGKNRIFKSLNSNRTLTV